MNQFPLVNNLWWWFMVGHPLVLVFYNYHDFKSGYYVCFISIFSIQEQYIDIYFFFAPGYIATLFPDAGVVSGTPHLAV